MEPCGYRRCGPRGLRSAPSPSGGGVGWGRAGGGARGAVPGWPYRLASLLLLSLALAAPAGAARDYATASQALARHFPPPATTTRKVAWLTPAQVAEIERRSGERPRRVVPYYEARRGGALLGYAFVDDVIGRTEPITYLAAISPEATVIGVDLLTFRESHGYQVEGQGWRDQFRGRRLAPELHLGRAIDSISGATLSARAITRGIRRLLATAEVVFAAAERE